MSVTAPNRQAWPPAERRPSGLSGGSDGVSGIGRESRDDGCGGEHEP